MNNNDKKKKNEFKKPAPGGCCAWTDPVISCSKEHLQSWQGPHLPQ